MITKFNIDKINSYLGKLNRSRNKDAHTDPIEMEELETACSKMNDIYKGIDELYNGKKTIVFELNREEFVKMRNILKGGDEDKDRFKIDISGVEFIYLLDE